MQAVGPDQAKVKLATGPISRIRLHDHIGTSASTSQGPQAFIVEMLEPNAKLSAHLHDVDQFQVTVAGSGKLGRYVESSTASSGTSCSKRRCPTPWPRRRC